MSYESFPNQPERKSYQWLEEELARRTVEIIPEGYVPFGAYTDKPFESIQGRTWLEITTEHHPDMVLSPLERNRRFLQPYEPEAAVPATAGQSSLLGAVARRLAGRSS
jgi:hypothetical protein